MENKTAQGDSNYSRRYALRRSADNGKENPMPRPFNPDYIPSRGNKHPTQPDFVLMKHENGPMVSRMRNPEHRYASPKKPLVNPTKKYDHYKMNYFVF
jgi:hypothetical protein